MTSSLHEAQIKQLRAAFKIVDVENEGHVNSEQLYNVLQSLGYQNVTQKQCAEIIKKYISSEGRKTHFDFVEFLSLMTRHLLIMSDLDLQNQFAKFDRQQKGYLEKEDLAKLMQSIGEVMSEAELEEMIKELDPNGENKIRFAEWKKMMQEEE